MNLNNSLENSLVQNSKNCFENKVRIVALIEYVGTFFHGLQMQSNHHTVQSALEMALHQLKIPFSSMAFSGRTDAGVHAVGQVWHFDVPAKLAEQRVDSLQFALNRHLPDAISVKYLQVALHPKFHSRKHAIAKWYRYRIYHSQHRSAWAMQNAAAHIWEPIDIDAMREAFSLLEGEHCFTSFKNINTAVKSDICNIFHTEIKEVAPFIELNVVANRFLYKMVRTIVGQLLVIGRQSRSGYASQSILDVLAQNDRRVAAPPAPAHGLTLMAVQYPKELQHFEDDVWVQQLNTILTLSKMEPHSHAKDLFGKAS
jgi:tRNA pseudouridine38-40 synthase